MMLHFKEQKGQRGAWVGRSVGRLSSEAHGTSTKIQPPRSVAPSEPGADWLLPQALYSRRVELAGPGIRLRGGGAATCFPPSPSSSFSQVEEPAGLAWWDNTIDKQTLPSPSSTPPLLPKGGGDTPPSVELRTAGGIFKLSPWNLFAL